MGKFSGVLIASDYDNTLVFTEEALKNEAPLPPVSRENCEAITYFMEQGGIFSVATGRALPAFSPIIPDVPNNGPTILFNGAAIYDFSQEKYLCTAFLPDDCRKYVDEILCSRADAGVEIYHADNSIHAVQPNEITRQHSHLTHSPTVTIASALDAPLPISKVLFEIDAAHSVELYKQIMEKPWANDFEIIPSSKTLTEMTAKGANKGGMVQKLASLLHIAPENLYCIGDQANDLPMLLQSAIPFAPSNAIQDIKQLPGIHLLPHCQDHAIAAMIAELDQLY